MLMHLKLLAWQKRLTKLLRNYRGADVTQTKSMAEMLSKILSTTYHQKFYKKLLINNFSADDAQTTTMTEMLHKVA